MCSALARTQVNFSKSLPIPDNHVRATLILMEGTLATNFPSIEDNSVRITLPFFNLKIGIGGMAHASHDISRHIKGNYKSLMEN